MLDDRRITVLEALVEEYISTGEPVSSAAVLERSGLNVSSATIRNDLSRLESYGFVSQPHTSAGRVPTPTGYRFYVDTVSPAKLRSTTRLRIDSFFAEVGRQLSSLLKETSGLLSDLSHYPAVVIGPGFAGEHVRAFHLVPLAESALLAVTISDTGRVSQDVVRVHRAPNEEDRAEAEHLLVRAFSGKSIADGLEKSTLRPEGTSAGVWALVEAVNEAMRGVDQRTKDVYIGGTAQLAELWKDLAHVQTILGLLEHQSQLAKLIDDESVGTTVRLSSDLDVDEIDLAVVSSSYDAGDHGKGRIGVIGPMRMEYRRTIKLVEEVGEGLGDSLGR